MSLDTERQASPISALVLAAVSGTACALPAWRAARLDPNAVLRAD